MVYGLRENRLHFRVLIFAFVFCFQFSNGLNRESTCLQGPDCFMVSAKPYTFVVAYVPSVGSHFPTSSLL
jgi:hypothetical protein